MKKNNIARWGISLAAAAAALVLFEIHRNVMEIHGNRIQRFPLKDSISIDYQYEI